jgi:predicted transcriptional regulator
MRFNDISFDKKIFLAIVLLKFFPTIGRYTLKDILNLSEGIIRSLLKDLSKKNFLKPTKAGSELTSKGKKFLEKLLISSGIIDVKEFEGLKLISAKYCFGIHVKLYKKTFSELELRDEAVKKGAKGAITMIFKDNKLIVPSLSNNFIKEYLEDLRNIELSFSLNEGDIIILSFGNDKWRALEGGISAAISLIT